MQLTQNILSFRQLTKLAGGEGEILHRQLLNGLKST